MEETLTAMVDAEAHRLCRAGPKYWAEVEYRDITTDGLLRHTTFKGLYDSKKSKHPVVAKFALSRLRALEANPIVRVSGRLSGLHSLHLSSTIPPVD